MTETQGWKRDLEAVMKERDELRQWVDDLQSGMYINCVYCGHRYGPDDQVSATMADALKEHVEQCPAHPMAAIAKERDELQRRLNKLTKALPPEKARLLARMFDAALPLDFNPEIQAHLRHYANIAEGGDR